VESRLRRGHQQQDEQQQTTNDTGTGASSSSNGTLSVDVQRKRNALYARRSYEKRKLEALVLQNDIRIAQNQQKVLQAENRRLQQALNECQQIILTATTIGGGITDAQGMQGIQQQHHHQQQRRGSTPVSWGLFLLCFLCSFCAAVSSSSSLSSGIDRENINMILQTVRHHQKAFDRKDRPFISLCFAQSIDGKLALYTDTTDESHNSGETTSNLPISGEASLLMTHALRSYHDGILVGGRTFRIDNPGLSNRLWLPHNSEQPRPVVLDSSLQNFYSLLAAGDSSPKAQNLIVCCSDKVSLPPMVDNPHDVEFLPCRTTNDGTIDINDALWKLKTLYGIQTLMVEGGPRILSVYLDSGLFDCICITLAPTLFGSGLAISLNKACHLEDGDMTMFQLGKDICIVVTFPKHVNEK
jgi:riboflavin-specific deaminase-like protein